MVRIRWPIASSGGPPAHFRVGGNGSGHRRGESLESFVFHPREQSRMNLTETDPQIADLIRQEEQRQASTLELIASENHVSKAVMEAAGTVLTNKYAEGYPGARYYGGCGFYDEIENLAIDRAKQLFGCKYANVQPHSD